MVIEGAGKPDDGTSHAGLSDQEQQFVRDLASEGLSAKSIARLGSLYQSSGKNAFYAYAVDHIAQGRT